MKQPKKSADKKSSTKSAEKTDSKQTKEQPVVAKTKPADSGAAKSAPKPEPPPAPVAAGALALPTTKGKIGVFGGPKDRGIKPDDKLALPIGPHFVYERARSLNPKSFYCAMRWNYHLEHMSPEEAKRWWANKKILVTNAKTNAAVVVRAVDYGPHENTGLDISVSPGSAEALGVEIGDEVQIAFAESGAKLGPVNG